MDELDRLAATVGALPGKALGMVTGGLKSIGRATGLLGADEKQSAHADELVPLLKEKFE